MRIAVLSDIHGNVFALERVLSEIKRDAVDQYIFCGDICGYYYLQNEAMDMIRSLRPMANILGNHDQAFLNALDDEQALEEYSARYGGSLQYLKGHISQDNLAFLKAMPASYESRDGALAAFHGSPWDKLNGYVYPTDPVDKFGTIGYQYVLLGHTHYPMHRKVGGVQIVNPGSVGQPRDDAKASYAIVDLKAGSVTLKRVAYDTNLVVEDLKRRHEENPYLYTVLNRKNDGK